MKHKPLKTRTLNIRCLRILIWFLILLSGGSAFFLCRFDNNIFQEMKNSVYSYEENVHNTRYLSANILSQKNQLYLLEEHPISDLKVRTTYSYKKLYSDSLNNASSIAEPISDNTVHGLTTTILWWIILCQFCIVATLSILLFHLSRRYRKNYNKLMIQQKRYKTLFQNTLGAFWEYDVKKDSMKKSDSDFGVYIGHTEIDSVQNFIGSHLDIIYPDDYPIFLETYHQMRIGSPKISCEIRAKDITGKYVWFRITGSTIHGNDGTPVQVIGQTNNINETKRAFEELSENAKKDSLTKLYNRRTAMELINKEILNSSPDSVHAFFMIDIDNFKNINDTYGHTFGDAVLLELSTQMTKTFSGRHILARFGGDEFIAFTIDIPSKVYVRELASKISKAFNSIYIDESNHQSITGSIGISLYPKDGVQFEDLFQKADMALYYSKSVGKNCFSFYTIDLMSSMEYLPSPKKNDDTPRHYLHTSDRTVIDNAILSNTVDVLCDAKKLDTSINLMLNMIGNYYELDNLCIYELSQDKCTLDITFEWASSKAQKLTRSFKCIPVEIAEDLEFYKNSSSGIFYHNDARSLPYQDSKYTQTIRQLHRNSLFQCAIMEQGQYQGYIEAVRNKPEKPWTKVELDTIALITKIIGGYLLKLRIQETANELSKKDILTGANNLFTFSQEAATLIKQNPDQQFILLYTDINNFKSINENYGYSEGDHVLRHFSHLLSEMLEEKETYGRITADRFVVLLKYESDTTLDNRLNTLNVQVNSLKKTLSDKYKISLVMGIYKITPSDSDISSCIDRANIARKSISDRHKTKYAYFNESMKSRLLKQKEIEEVMEEALAEEEFLVYYQPKFNLEHNNICGAEALVRWQRENGRIIFPGDFIPIFEDNGFIIELDFYVLEHVCRELRQLLDTSRKVVPISVNFSRVHLRDAGFVPKLISVVNEYNVPPELIEVEITESALVSNNEFLFSVLDEIHSHGFKLTMDDFGSGLSSLNLLQKLPFDVLKLDKDFFQKGAATKKERTIIEYIVKMALELHMEIVSEGVETLEQAEFLKSIHCPIVQGYLYEKPIPRNLFIEKYC